MSLHVMLIVSGVAGALVFASPTGAAAPVFPDVPPWHWASDAASDLAAKGIVVGYPATAAELANNSITQVYEGFLHSSEPHSGTWVERFTYNRPANWPAIQPPSYALRWHVPIASYALNGMRVLITSDTATATFTATVTTRSGAALTGPMRVGLRYNGSDWQVDYAALAAGSPVFR